MSAEDLRKEYAEYLERFVAQIGEEVEVGTFAKFKGKLIKKLDPAEFGQLNTEYHELAAHYLESLDRGDTINDVVVKQVRELAAKLVLTAPV
jgi:hypothetical protein